MLIDEFDTVMKGSPEAGEAYRGLLNGAFERDDSQHIMNIPLPGGGWEQREFSAFTPLLVAAPPAPVVVAENEERRTAERLGEKT